MRAHRDLMATDDVYARLWREYADAGNELDAATDGAIHHGHPRDVADRMVWAIERRYMDASAAWLAYRDRVTR